MSVEDVVWLDAEAVREIHDTILEPDQLAGESGTRSIDAIVARVINQAAYGAMHGDVLETAATYAVVIARGHAFNDGNKRTALTSAALFLRLNGYEIELDGEPLAEIMVRVASGETDEVAMRDELTTYLRAL